MNSHSVCSMSEVSCARLVLLVAQFVKGRLGLPLANLGNPLIRIHHHALQFVGKIEFGDQSLALSSNGSFARLNNSVIRGTNTVPPEVYAQ
jgi:hypothetical protein